MSIGIALSPGSLGTSSNVVGAAIEYGREAARCGLRSLWFGQTFTFDSAIVAALVGAAVPELAVGTSAIPITARHPLLLASQAQTAQAATNGRFTLGLGLGTQAFSEPVFGMPFDRPIRRLREFLTALRPVLTDGTVDFHGETLTASNPLPASVAGAEPPVSVLVAAMGPQALRATGELADGSLPFLVGPRALERSIVAPLTEAAEGSGRPRPRVAVLVPGVVTADAASVRAAAAEQMAFYDEIPSYRRIIESSGVECAVDLVALGDEEVIAQRIAEYFDAGATDVVFTQTDLGGEAARRRTWQLLGELARTRGTPAAPV